MTETVAPWRGRQRVDDPRKRFVAVRCNDGEYATMNAKAALAGMAIGAFLRTLGTGAPGPRARRRPPLEKKALAQVLGLLGRVGGNVNQLTRVANTTGDLPIRDELASIGADVRAMRAALMKALGHGD